VRIARGIAQGRDLLLRRLSLETPDLPSAVRDDIRRVFGAELDAAGVVERILRDVRREGDAAVRRYNREIDRLPDGIPLEVSKAEVEQAYSSVEPGTAGALKQAADRIRDFHERQREHSSRSFEHEGIGQIVRPIERAGLYVPGTKVVYPSTVLMLAVPARVAGVSVLIMVTPAAPDGAVSALKLVAADIAGVDRIFRAGGVQGIGALAYGTESVPAVHKICGPGNIFVTIAKKQLFGEVGIDGIFGPSETLIVADDSADPDLVAADLLAAAEHDELATSVLITTSATLAEAANERVEARLGSLARADVARASTGVRGGIVIVGSLEEGMTLANEFAPEHMCLHTAPPSEALAMVRNAGAVFVGESSVESIGDYTAGPSHVMPTGGNALYASPIGVHDFLKVTSVVSLRQELVDHIGPAAAAIARAEGLTGHAESIEARLKEQS
jgi:histidinol dehydrogenase